jgi:hypothetical protein
MGAFGARVVADAAVGRPRITDAMRAVVDTLTAAGIRATVDVREVNPPCCWVQLPTIRFRFATPGAFNVDFAVLAVVGNSGNRWADLDAISDLTAAAQEALGDRVATARPADMWTTDGTGTLPAMELTWTDTVRR